MKENYSLYLTSELTKLLHQDLSGVFYELFPFEEVDRVKPKKSRDRLYSTSNTLLTMILTMINEDKSLQNSVNIYSFIHNKSMQRIESLEQEIQAMSADTSIKRKPGRPKKTAGRIAKSKRQPISRDTSGYSQARQRLPTNTIELVYEASKALSGLKYPGTWHGYRVFIADGTYLQLQDTEPIKEKFHCPDSMSYPRGLLESIIEQGSGIVYDYVLGSDSKSELELIAPMISHLPNGSLLMADDLYNCFAIFSLLKKQGVEVIAPAKRKRNYNIIKAIAPGDDIIEIKKSNEPKWLNGIDVNDKVLLMRRIEYPNPAKESEMSVLYTSILNEKISKDEIILKYESRWDIEISIRELKTLMDINVVRSKSPDMVYKEVTTALIAYNYLRKIIVKTTEESGFSPEGDIIQKYYEINNPILLDKLGRKYYKWSPGRFGYSKDGNTKA